MVADDDQRTVDVWQQPAGRQVKMAAALTLCSFPVGHA